MGDAPARHGTRRGARGARGDGTGTHHDRDGAGSCHLRVGVTGHRRMPDDPRLAERVAEAVARIRELAEPPHRPVRFTAVSALAEGADRLVAETILREPGGALHAVLPLTREDYADDFEEPESRREFAALLDAASRVSVLPPCATRDAAYEAAGVRVVDEVDALIALWDGLPARGQGGTAHVVALARDRGLPLFWLIPAAPYPLWEELGNGLPRCPDTPARDSETTPTA